MNDCNTSLCSVPIECSTLKQNNSCIASTWHALCTIDIEMRNDGGATTVIVKVNTLFGQFLKLEKE